MPDSTNLSVIRVVLSQTSHPGNIGAAARAIKTMGLSQLYLVRPKLFPHSEALALASGADDVLGGAVVCDSLDEALAGTVLAVAATARNRELSHQVVPCREACHRVVTETSHGDVAVVFGTERTGLTIAEVNKCGLIATIPTGNYASLNLAQAVQVFAYELRMAATGPEWSKNAGSGANMATHDEVERFYDHLEAVLYESGFLDRTQPGRMMQRLRRLFARARLEKEEVNILRGIFSALQDKGQ
ncbi:MAG: TrmJ/YjtD family RNA methyltransferase [Burkholderiales bacterium]|nr:TrmJ/YjtD family RNA methyltransferase [Burkholderiales bacterium]